MAKRKLVTRTMRCYLASIALALLVPNYARAECKQEDRETEATAFRQGLAKFRDGDTTGAVEIWQGLLKTLGTECGWKVLFNLGRGYERLGDPTRAIESYEAFVEAVNKQTKLSDKERKVKSAAESSIAALKAKYGAIFVAAPSSGVVWVRVGLGEPQPAGFTLYVAPGTHEVELFSRTPNAEKQTIQVVAGQVATITIPESTAAPTPAPTAPAQKDTLPSPQPEPRSFPTALVAIGSGLTVAAAGTSVFLYTRQSSKREDAEALPRTDPKYAQLRDEHQDARTVYHVGLVVTGVFATATTAVVLAHVLGSDDSPTHVQAGIAPGAASLGLSGQF